MADTDDSRIRDVLHTAVGAIHHVRAADRISGRVRALIRSIPPLLNARKVVRSLPSSSIELSDSRDGREIATRMVGRSTLVARDSTAAGVLVLADPPESYLRGKRRQALRTNISRARAAGITCARPTDEELLRLVPVLVRVRGDDPAYEEMLLGRIRRREGRFWVATASDGSPLALAMVVVDGATAYLAWMLSDPSSEQGSDARYLLSAEVFVALAGEGVTRVLTPSILSLSPGLLHFQHLLGFRPANIEWSVSAARNPV